MKTWIIYKWIYAAMENDGKERERERKNENEASHKVKLSMETADHPFPKLIVLSFFSFFSTTTRYSLILLPLLALSLWLVYIILDSIEQVRPRWIDRRRHTFHWDSCRRKQ